MRLTPDMVLEGDQGLNCLGDRELALRNLAIPAIENLALAKDGFDLIDLTSNQITLLGDGFPPFPRLRSLYLGGNRVERIETGLAASLPNLTSLVLTSNRIASVQALNVPELAKLRQLETLSILDNPVATAPRLRDLLIGALPCLKVLNFSKISADERQTVMKKAGTATAAPRANGRHKRKRAEGPNQRVGVDRAVSAGDDNRTEVDGLEPLRPAKKSRKLTNEESQAVKAFIDKAQSIKDVTRIQEALRNGTVAQFLKSAKVQPGQ